MRGDRLLSILLMLQDSGVLTAKVLAKRLEVSERTIHRDMEALSTAGIPVMADRGSAGGWRLMKGYKTDLTGLTREELQALLLAASVRLPSDTDMRIKLESALVKLVTAAPSEHLSDVKRVRERLHIDGIGWNNHHEPTPWLPLIQEAVWNDNTIEIRYSKGDQTVERIVKPLGIVAKGKVWYMIANVDTETRTYRISRIVEARLTGDHYDRPAYFDLASWWQASTAAFYEQLPRFHALLRMEEDQLDKLKRIRYVNVQAVRDVPSSQVSHLAPLHSLDVEVIFDTIEVACEVLFSFALTVEALEPAILRETLLKRAQLLVTRYQV